jgi:hypothetical protein
MDFSNPDYFSHELSKKIKQRGDNIGKWKLWVAFHHKSKCVERNDGSAQYLEERLFQQTNPQMAEI